MPLVKFFNVFTRYPKLILILIVVIPVLLLVALLTAAGTVTKSSVSVVSAAQTIQAFRPVYQTNYVKYRSIYGTAEAVQQSQLGFQRAGVVKKISVDEGQWVAKGTIVAELDTAALDAQLAESQASLARIS